MNQSDRIGVVHAGVGPVGCRVIALILERPEMELVGVVDADPKKCGQPVEEFVPKARPLGLKIEADTTACLKRTRAAAMTHTTVSYLPECIDHLREIARSGVAMASSTEELLFPWLRNYEWAAELDELCRASGARMLGTGVNPGFVMDLLPIVASLPCERLRRVRAARVVDAAKRRGPLQRKVGAGLTLDAFAERVALGRFGHVGFCESAALLAAGLGWKLDSVMETIEPVIAETAVRTEFVEVLQGQAAGIHQDVRGVIDGEEVIQLDLKMYVGAADPHDVFELDGDPPIGWRSARGVAGDPATSAILVNSIRRLMACQPGLRTILDLPAAVWSGPGANVKLSSYY